MAKSDTDKLNPASTKRKLTYADSGVDIEAGDHFADLIRAHMRRTHGPRVIANDGGFAGLFRLDYNETIFKRNFRDPVLVACTDGVGTKIKLAAQLDAYDTIGQDLVAMNLNDLVVQGAEPLFFLDYIACHKVQPQTLERIVAGIAEACRTCNTALIGGETAEMSDVYAPGEIDLAGFAVGVVELKKASDPSRVEPGDVVIGLESDGVHSNGFSLVRAVIKESRLDLSATIPDLNDTRSLADILLTPTRLYAAPIVTVLRRYRVKKIITGMAHITGGGLEANLSRALHPSVDAVIHPDAWHPNPIFEFLQKHADIDPKEMERTFNMGIGFCLIVRPSFAPSVAAQLEDLGERPHVIGSIVKGSGKVDFRPRV